MDLNLQKVEKALIFKVYKGLEGDDNLDDKKEIANWKFSVNFVL